MALSNIRKEPRREITESLVGITVLLLLIFFDHPAAVWFHEVTGGCPVPLGMILVPIALILLIGVTYLFLWSTHALGELVCGTLATFGLELRPKRRCK